GFLPAFFALSLGVGMESAAAYRYPLMLASVVLLPGVYILFRIKHIMPAPYSEEATAAELESASAGTTEKPILVNRSPLGLYSPVVIALIMLAVVRFFTVSGVATANTFFNVFADTKLAVPTVQIGLIVAGARLLGVFSALSTPIVVARWGAAMTIFIA